MAGLWLLLQLGVTSNSTERAKALISSGVDAIVIDTAHGHTKRVVDLLKELKKIYPDTDIIVGNVATAAAASFLIKKRSRWNKSRNWSWFNLYNKNCCWSRSTTIICYNGCLQRSKK